MVVSGAWLFFLLVGMAHMPDPADDKLYIEIQSQILCGLFQIAAMVKQPGRAMALCRWCSDPPGEPTRSRALVSILFLNANCLFQYCVCVFMWGWAADYLDRPPWGVPLFLVLSMSTEIVGGLIAPKKHARLSASGSNSSESEAGDSEEPAESFGRV